MKERLHKPKSFFFIINDRKFKRPSGNTTDSDADGDPSLTAPPLVQEDHVPLVADGAVAVSIMYIHMNGFKSYITIHSQSTASHIDA